MAFQKWDAALGPKPYLIFGLVLLCYTLSSGSMEIL